MEIINGVERRRRWRPEEKLRILAELDEPGAKFNDVARRHDLSRGLLWQWREARQRGRLVEDGPVFVPLRIVPELPGPERDDAGAVTAVSSLGSEKVPDGSGHPVEIILPDGTVLRVAEGIALPALRRLLSALRG
ncbi:transposase [Roseomonas sp. CCTCC AB2023176]|uniref:IS66-like element accessory protein TnpA n=1 Tax=Roseomonas sp. CCTCC AB2023176 TaxID=3342640 RepID=UPI0035DDAE4D